MTLRRFFKALAIVGGLATASIVATLGPATIASAETHKHKKQKFFFMLKAGPQDTARSFMALGVMKMLATQGHQVKAFLNLDAVRLVDKRQPLDLKSGHREGTLQDAYDKAIKAGVMFIACPMCSKAAGLTKDNLRPGVIFGNAKIVGGGLAEADKVINY